MKIISISIYLAFVALVLASLGLLPQVQAVDPPPDGGYAGLNTAEGQNALFSLSSGVANTAIGGYSLFANTVGNLNTGIGAGALLFNTGDNNTATGALALLSNTTGFGNTANGANALSSNTTGAGNTATGISALNSNVGGTDNTAVGTFALLYNTGGNSNTAVGRDAMETNVTGNNNTAVGRSALAGNGDANTALGFVALGSNTTGSQNTAAGNSALASNTDGNYNTATGLGALRDNNGGDNNTANGINTLLLNVDGDYNTAVGVNALQHTQTDSNTAIGSAALLNLGNNGGLNTAVGANALLNSTAEFGNTAIGESALRFCIGSINTALGWQAGSEVTTAHHVICIQSPGANVDVSCFIGHIRETTTAQNNAIPVLIDSVGQLGTVSSSRRFKKEIQAMDTASEAILALKPVTFHYKTDKANRPEFGLIAEEVAEINPDLVVRDEKGEIYTVRYDAVNAMLLNEFLKEHKAFVEEQRKVQKQGASIARLEQQIEALTAGLQKVSAQLQLSKSAAQTVVDNL